MPTPTLPEARPHDLPALRQVGGHHYLTMAVQPWEAMASWMTREQFAGFLIGNVIKYVARYNSDAPTKGGVVDLEKARHYLDKLIEQERRP